jgi:hypothetical protein
MNTTTNNFSFGKPAPLFTSASANTLERRKSETAGDDTLSHVPRDWSKRYNEESQQFDSLVILCDIRLRELRAQKTGCEVAAQPPVSMHASLQHQATSSPTNSYDWSSYRIAYSYDIFAKFFDALSVLRLFDKCKPFFAALKEELLRSIYFDCDSLMSLKTSTGPNSGEHLIQHGQPYGSRIE